MQSDRGWQISAMVILRNFCSLVLEFMAALVLLAPVQSISINTGDDSWWYAVSWELTVSVLYWSVVASIQWKACVDFK